MTGRDEVGAAVLYSVIRKGLFDTGCLPRELNRRTERATGVEQDRKRKQDVWRLESAWLAHSSAPLHITRPTPGNLTHDQV